MSTMEQRSIAAPGGAAVAHANAASFTRSSRREARQYRWMVAVAFPLMLAMATVARMSGWRWQPWPPGPLGYRSVVTEAKEAAVTYVGFAFASW